LNKYFSSILIKFELLEPKHEWRDPANQIKQCLDSPIVAADRPGVVMAKRTEHKPLDTGMFEQGLFFDGRTLPPLSCQIELGVAIAKYRLIFNR